MNTLQTVFTKLSKDETKLGSHKVDLALVDDIKEANKKYMPLWSKANSDYNSAIVNLKAALDIVTQVEQLVNKGQAQVKELGLTDTFFSSQMTAIKEEKTKVTSLLNKLK